MLTALMYGVSCYGKEKDLTDVVMCLKVSGTHLNVWTIDSLDNSPITVPTIAQKQNYIPPNQLHSKDF